MQRSQDFVVTASINPAQYVMLGMIVANHLTFKTGIKHEVGKFLHIVQNCHIYEAHLSAAKEILEREPINEQPLIKLNCKPKDFYEHTIDDFEFILPKGIKKLENNLELMV
jgi:thymidylate synthase